MASSKALAVVPLADSGVGELAVGSFNVSATDSKLTSSCSVELAGGRVGFGVSDVFFSIFDNKPVRLHKFVSPNLHEDVLISADHLEALALLPPKWPHYLNPKHKDYSANYTANSLKQEKAEEQRDQATKSSSSSEEDPDTIPVRIPRTRVNLDEELWQDTGEVHDIPKLDTFPEETRQILLKYGNVFKSSLSKARKMKTNL